MIINSKLLTLPDHLRTTLLTLNDIGQHASANDIADKTKRARAVESNYLNQLTLLGLVAKQNYGRITHFNIKYPVIPIQLDEVLASLYDEVERKLSLSLQPGTICANIIRLVTAARDDLRKTMRKMEYHGQF